jgi:hypothetical protein
MDALELPLSEDTRRSGALGCGLSEWRGRKAAVDAPPVRPAGRAIGRWSLIIDCGCSRPIGGLAKRRAMGPRSLPGTSFTRWTGGSVFSVDYTQ